MSMNNKMYTKLLFAAQFAIALWVASTLASFAADPTGTWLTEEGEGTMRISNCGGALCATVVSLKEPNDRQTGRPKTDIHNADASKRDRPLVGVQILMA